MPGKDTDTNPDDAAETGKGETEQALAYVHQRGRERGLTDAITLLEDWLNDPHDPKATPRSLLATLRARKSRIRAHIEELEEADP